RDTENKYNLCVSVSQWLIKELTAKQTFVFYLSSLVFPGLYLNMCIRWATGGEYGGNGKMAKTQPRFY
ncbi:MAG TPA: hypothetical protein VFA32_08580, partial [Dehalococcoidia bacterium]|nr:hypothetical protein [Dehalococcoidia bacterium]